MNGRITGEDVEKAAGIAPALQTSAEACPTKQRYDYQFTDPSYNWRALRVITAAHHFGFARSGGTARDHKNVTHSEIDDLKARLGFDNRVEIDPMDVPRYFQTASDLVNMIRLMIPDAGLVQARARQTRT